MTGTIRKIHERGYFFIAPDGEDARGGEIFAHASRLAGIEFENLQRGMRVEFDTEMTAKGLQAVEIRQVENVPAEVQG